MAEHLHLHDLPESQGIAHPNVTFFVRHVSFFFVSLLFTAPVCWEEFYIKYIFIFTPIKILNDLQCGFIVTRFSETII